MFDSLKEWLSLFAEKSLRGFGETMDNVITIVSEEATEWDTIVNISESFQPFCYTIVGICLLIEILQISSRADMLKWEHALKIGIKLTLTRVCIEEAPKFLQACYLQAVEWMNLFVGHGGWVAVVLDELSILAFKAHISAINGMGNILGMFTSCLLIFIAVNVCGLILQIIAYGRMFEIYSYLLISPLPFAFLPLGTGDGFGVNPITANFIKNFIAACVQGVMIMAAIYIYKKVLGTRLLISAFTSMLTLNHVEAVTDASFIMLLNSVLLVMVVSKSSSIAKSLINAM